MSLRWPLAQHIYLSPHLDDAVLSCGGLIYEQAHSGESVAVMTIFAAGPSPNQPLSPFAQSLHARWQASAPAGVDFSDPAALRRAEDRRALAALHPAIQVVHYILPDCIYRVDPIAGQALYANEQAIFGAIQPTDPALTDLRSVPPLPDDTLVYVPLGIGHHVDHQVVHWVVSDWGFSPRSLCYYEDYPYVTKPGVLDAALGDAAGWDVTIYPVAEESMVVKIRAVAAYASQISSFWANEETMRAALQGQIEQTGGERLWQLRA